MRVTTLGLLLPLSLFSAGCGNSMQPFVPFDSGAPTGDDLSTGGGTSKDMAGAKGDLAGTDGGEFDEDGPTIVINTPMAGSFVNGFFTVQADISDPSGVDPSSVTAEFGNVASSAILLKSTGGNTYQGVFDVRTLAPNYVLASISVRAKDGVGNESQIGEVIVIDTVRPWMTMDAGKSMWVGKKDATTPANVDCSQPFSPLGSDATHEGQVVQQLITLRTRIEDAGNNAPGLALVRISLIDESSVQMFVIHDDGQTPLAVDTDGDTDTNHYCDDVNPLLIPTAGPVVMQNEALSLQLAPMPITGAADFSGTGTAPSQCSRIGDGTTTTAPNAICTDTSMTYVKGYSSPPKPAIWTLPPIKVGDPVDCSGFQLDAANQLPEGPACVITRAVDNAGNVEVSFPLHICIDGPNHMCGSFSPTPSHCTGRYDKATMTLKPGSCIEPLSGPSAPLNGPATFPPNDFQFLP